jgi:hypothetical protein
MTYCARCRLGTLDAGGLCVLCGAPATPPSKRRRLAEAIGGLVAAALSPAALAIVAAAALLVSVALVTQFGAQAPAGAPRLGLPGPNAALALGSPVTRAEPAGTVVRLLLAAFWQALVFALVLGVLLAVWRRRQRVGSRQ